VKRRTMLTAAGIGLLPSSALAARAAAPAAADWKALDASIAGTVERPGTAGYDQARQLVDPRFDGVRPPAVARCRSAADVVEVIGFARRHGLPVVPRGGGHSYVGASTGVSGVVVDARALATVRYDAASRTAIIGGGARLLDVYEQLGKSDVSIPSGACGTVGIGGITLGGGMGMASSAYGLTCDAVIAADLVTSDGRHRTVDARREPDLFWALRGGGGGRLGIVTAWRMRTFGVSTVGQFTLTFPWAQAQSVAAGWQSRLAETPDRNWSTLQFTADAQGRRGVKINGFSLAADPKVEADAIVAAIRRDPIDVKLDQRGYLPTVRARAGSPERGTELVGSDVFGGPLPPRAIDAILAVVAKRAAARQPGVAKLKPLTGAVSRLAADATAFPWRDALTLMQWLVQPTDGLAATVTSGYDFVNAGHRAVAPWSAGRYVNYLEPDFAALPRYHGPHLTRLRKIRTAADPHRLFQSPSAA
jgi:hypothetical protein